MNTNHYCDPARDVGYLNVCQICGVPLDANYFDVADIKAAPQPGQEVELARYGLHHQYCGTLLYFTQYAEAEEARSKKIVKTPGYEWVILCNNQPRAPYLPTRLILNPWGCQPIPVHLRLEEGCEVKFVVRKVSPAAGEEDIPLSQVGGRLVGRSWYNTAYGGAPNRL